MPLFHKHTLLHGQKYVNTQTNYVDTQILHPSVTEHLSPNQWAAGMLPSAFWQCPPQHFGSWLQGFAPSQSEASFMGRTRGTCPLHFFRRQYWTPPPFTVQKLYIKKPRETYHHIWPWNKRNYLLKQVHYQCKFELNPLHLQSGFILHFFAYGVRQYIDQFHHICCILLYEILFFCYNHPFHEGDI